MKKHYKLIILLTIIVLISMLFITFVKQNDSKNINQPIEYYVKACNTRNAVWFEKCFNGDEYTTYDLEGNVIKHYDNIKYSTKKFKEYMDRNDERYGKDWQLSYRILSCEWLEDLGYYEVSVELLFKGDLDYEVDEISFSIIKDRNKYYFTEGMRYLFLDIMV